MRLPRCADAVKLPVSIDKNSLFRLNEPSDEKIKSFREFMVIERFVYLDVDSPPLRDMFCPGIHT